MSEWKKCKLVEYSNINMGQSPKSEYYNNEEIGIPFLQGNRTFGIKYPTYDTYCSQPLKFANEGEILFSVRAPVGDINIANRKICIGRGLAALNAKNGKNDFLYFLLHYLKSTIVNNESGSVFGAVNKFTLENIDILLPPLPEQTAIASVLSSLDDKIDLLHRQNATLEKMAETLFRQWFVEEEWNGTLSEYIKVQGGFAFKSKDFKEKGFAGVIKIRNITMGMIDISNTDYVDQEVVNNIDKRFKITSGDFLIAMTGAEIGKIGIVEKTEKEIWVNQRVGKLEAKVPYGDLIGYLALKSREGQDHIINACAGSAQENISSSSIEEMNFIPYKAEITNSLGKEIEPLFKKIIFNQSQIRTLTALRDTLLPKLMSGEVRVEY